MGAAMDGSASRIDLIKAIAQGKGTVLPSRNDPALAHGRAYLMDDNQAEASRAICRRCGADTDGAWQHGVGGRRIRTPSEHTLGTSEWTGVTCPGSFETALLKEPSEKSS